jgi:glycosyltransferase involved in cell wall biosynthesis
MPPRAPSTAAGGVRRRFVFLSTCAETWGGSEELWWQAACELREAGHLVSVGKTFVDERHPRIRRLRQLGCPVHDLARGYRLSAIANLVLPARHELVRERRQMVLVAAAFAIRRPDLVVVSQGQNFDGAHLALLCAWMRIPYIVVSQKATEHHWPIDWARPHAARVFRSARHAVFVSEHNRALTEEQIGEPIPRAVVLRNPVLVGRDGPLPWPETNGQIRLACVGRLYPIEKGQDLLLKVLAGDRWRERPLHVSFYGEGVNRDGLIAMARHLGVENVSFEGQSARIADVWREHHGFVLPSRAEGLPLALVEAMMCGRVPVVTDVGGNAEVIDDEVTGFVAPSPTVAAYDDALERAWAARDRWREIGAAAARHIAELVPEEPGSPLAALALAQLEPRGTA